MTDLYYVNELNKFTLESGKFEIHVGSSSDNLYTLPLYVK